MNVSQPDLLTLLQWAERLATGETCAPWDVWRASSSDAAWKWKCIVRAQELLRTGNSTSETDSELSAEDLAQFAEGQLAAADARRVEENCWQSPAQLAELLSTLRFMHQPIADQASHGFEARLLALAPPPAPQRTNGKPPKFRLGTAVAAEGPRSDAQNAAPPVVAPAPATVDRRAPIQQFWPLVAAVLLVAVVLSGMVGWLAATWHHGTSPAPIAVGPDDDQTQPKVQVNDVPPPSIDVPPEAPGLPVPDNRPTPESAPPLDQPKPAADVTPPTAPSDSKVAPPRANPPPTPRFRPRISPPTPQLAFQSAQGVLLVDVGQRGNWRVAPSSHSLREPVNLLSLAESWTSVDVSGVGTLIWEGNAEASIQMLLDDLIEIRLIHGRMGIERLKADAQVRLVAGDAAWTVRGVDDRSTLAVVRDPTSPGLLVARGAVMVEEVELIGGQLTRWLDGAPQPPQPLVPAAATASGATPLSPPAMNPWDLAWLQPPNEIAKQQWRMLFGRLVERLSAEADVAGALPKLLAATRDPRQAALLARWNVAVASGPDRPQKTWDLLSDRRAPVRVAGVKSLLELPPGDERLQKLDQLLLAKVGAETTDRIKQWHSSAWLPGAPPKAQADEIVAHLQHNDFVVRQFAVSFLELYTAAAFQQMGTAPPAYDATATPARRVAAQLEWITIINQLYAPTRKGPAWTPRQMLQNAAPGGT